MRTPENVARAMWTLFEPIHAVTYFSPLVRESFAAIGLNRFWEGYFAGRAAPLGPVAAEPVVAIFSGFSPSIVGRALPGVWTTATPSQALVARSVGAASALRNAMPDEDLVSRAAAALTPVALSLDTVGRPLSAANLALPFEQDPYRQLWQAATSLREHRGEGHVMALVAEGIEGLTTIVLRSALDLDAGTMKRLRGWSDEQWDAEIVRLRDRGLLAADGAITSAGLASLSRAEATTNRLAAGPWHSIATERVFEIARALEPIALACAEIIAFPNPIGMARPWRADSDPDAGGVPFAPVASETPHHAG
jgi:hypothetical protein